MAVSAMSVVRATITVGIAIAAVTTAILASRVPGRSVVTVEYPSVSAWVLDEPRMALNRVNLATTRQEAVVPIPPSIMTGGPLTVLSDGTSALVVNPARGRAWTVDAMHRRLTGPQVVPTSASADGTYDLRGGTLALLDRPRGVLKLVRMRDDGAPASLTHGQEISVGGDATVAVGVDGSAYAVSGTTGTVTHVPVNDSGFAPDVKEATKARGPGLALSVVGEKWVVFEPAKDALYVKGFPRRSVSVDANRAARTPARVVLQHPSAASPWVLVQDPFSLNKIPLDSTSGGTPGVRLPQAIGPEAVPDPTRPVQAVGCGYAAWRWAGATFLGRTCPPRPSADDDLRQPVSETTAQRAGGLTRRPLGGFTWIGMSGQAPLLNESDKGVVLAMDQEAPRRVDDWHSPRGTTR